MASQTSTETSKLQIVRVEKENDFIAPFNRKEVEAFLYNNMQPYNDEPEDIRKALDYAFGANGSPGGYLMLAILNGQLAGVCVMLSTGMGGFIPETVLLYIGVDPTLRGHGIGGKLMKASIDGCEGDVKLHVEYNNPAKHLYERFGFTTKYAEMRYKR